MGLWPRGSCRRLHGRAKRSPSWRDLGRRMGLYAFSFSFFVAFYFLERGERKFVSQPLLTNCARPCRFSSLKIQHTSRPWQRSSRRMQIDLPPGHSIRMPCISITVRHPSPFLKIYILFSFKPLAYVAIWPG